MDCIERGLRELRMINRSSVALRGDESKRKKFLLQANALEGLCVCVSIYMRNNI